MTPAGHTLMGMSIGVLCVPRRWRWLSKVAMVGVFGVLGNAPDIANKFTPPGWYEICHSVFLNTGAMLVLALLIGVWWRRAGRPRGVWPIVVCGAGAWGSHLVLDATYNHGRGTELLWPFSKAPLVLTISWFSTWKLPWEDHDAWNVRVSSLEAAVYGGLFVLCVLVRVLLGRMKTRRDRSPAARDHIKSAE